MDILDSDLAYWTGQGWTNTPTSPATPAAPVSPTAPTSPTSPTAPAAGSTSTTTAANNQWVNDLYQQYFDRNATAAEMSNWQTLNPQQLQAFLINEQKVYGYTSKSQLAAKTDAQKKAEAIIDADPNLTPEMRNLAKATLNAYSGGITADAPAILAAFNKIKETTIDPKYADLVNAATSELKSNTTALEQQRATELEKQQALEKASIVGEQAALEKSGLTMSGEGIKQLGAQAATVPFGGQQVEGLIPQANRLIATDTSQRYQEDLRKQMSAGEQLLGTTGIQGIGGLPAYTAIGGLTGTLQTGKTQELASTLSSLAANQQAKTNLNTTLPSPV